MLTGVMPNGKLLQLEPGEYAAMMDARRRAIIRVNTTATLDGPQKPTDRHGYRGRVTILGRDRSGSLKLRVRVTAPHLISPYVQYVRLVKRRPLRLV
jgi:hypothetical protein